MSATSKRSCGWWYFLAFLIAVLAAWIPPTPGVYYDFRQNVKLGRAFGDLTYERNPAGYVHMRAADGRNAFWFPTPERRFDSPGLRGNVVRRGDLAVMATDLTGTPYLGDGFINFESTTYAGSFRIGNGPVNKCRVADYNRCAVMVVESRSEDTQRDTLAYFDSFGRPISPIPPINGYHFVVFGVVLARGIIVIQVIRRRRRAIDPSAI